MTIPANIRVNTQAPFPSLVKGSGAVTVAKQNGIWTVGISTTALQTIISTLITTPRERLTANRTYYVRTDGSDSNNGLANTSAGAFLTIQHACDVAVYTLDMNGFGTTIQVADGTYTEAVQIINLTVGGFLTIKGNTASPGNVIVTCANSYTFFVGDFAFVDIQDMQIEQTGAFLSGACLGAFNHAFIGASNVIFGASSGWHAQSANFSRINLGSYTLSGSAAAHLYAVSLGEIQIFFGSTVTLTGTPAFAIGFLQLEALGFIDIEQVTFAGTGATGPRFDLGQNSVIYTSSSSPTYLPGNSDGTIADGGIYHPLSKFPQRSVTSSPIVPAAFDVSLHININTGTPTCTLPLAAIRNFPLTFKDIGGHAAAHNIIITATPPDTIDGAAFITMSLNFQAVTLNPCFDGVNSGWFIT